MREIQPFWPDQGHSTCRNGLSWYFVDDWGFPLGLHSILSRAIGVPLHDVEDLVKAEKSWRYRVTMQRLVCSDVVTQGCMFPKSLTAQQQSSRSRHLFRCPAYLRCASRGRDSVRFSAAQDIPQHEHSLIYGPAAVDVLSPCPRRKDIHDAAWRLGPEGVYFCHPAICWHASRTRGIIQFDMSLHIPTASRWQFYLLLYQS